MSHKRIAKKLLKTLVEARDHLSYCGYGDSWERECAGDLGDRIESTIEQAEAQLLKK